MQLGRAVYPRYDPKVSAFICTVQGPIEVDAMQLERG